MSALIPVLKRIAPNVVMTSGLLCGYRRGHNFRKDYQIFQQKDEANGFFDRLVLLSKITIWKSLEILIL